MIDHRLDAAGLIVRRRARRVLPESFDGMIDLVLQFDESVDEVVLVFDAQRQLSASDSGLVEPAGSLSEATVNHRPFPNPIFLHFGAGDSNVRLVHELLRRLKRIRHSWHVTEDRYIERTAMARMYLTGNTIGATEAEAEELIRSIWDAADPLHEVLLWMHRRATAYMRDVSMQDRIAFELNFAHTIAGVAQSAIIGRSMSAE